MPVMDGFESAQRMRQHEEAAAAAEAEGRVGTGAGRRMTIIGISAMSDTQV